MRDSNKDPTKLNIFKNNFYKLSQLIFKFKLI